MLYLCYLKFDTDAIIVFVWSQYGGANIEQRTIGYCWRQNQEATLTIVGGDICSHMLVWDKTCE